MWRWMVNKKYPISSSLPKGCSRLRVGNPCYFISTGVYLRHGDWINGKTNEGNLQKKLTVNSIVNDICRRISIGNLVAMH